MRSPHGKARPRSRGRRLISTKHTTPDLLQRACRTPLSTHAIRPGPAVALKDGPPKELRDKLAKPRLERATGVIYRPESELASHYFEAVLPRQFDEGCVPAGGVIAGPAAGPADQNAAIRATSMD